MNQITNNEFIDNEHIINKKINDCKVTIYFAKNKNPKVERMILENLLDTFEKRINTQIA